VKKMAIFLCLTVVLGGCSMGNKTLAAKTEGSNTIEVARNTALESKSNEIIEETKSPEVTATDNTNGENEQNPEPQYIKESDYEGDELGIVKTLNLYMKAFYKRDHDAFYKLLAKDNDWTIDDFKKYFVSIDKLDFSVKPDPAPPEDVKPVVLEYREKMDDREEIEVDKQLFLFRFEDGAWKLVAIADWW
jgi:hypothetical protein